MHVRNIICHVDKGRRMHVNKVYAHLLKNVNAVSQVEEAYACKHDAASDSGDCDAA